MVPFRSSYDMDFDVIKFWYLTIIAGILAVFFHSNLNRSVLGDFAWAFSQYLETFTILSQFILFSKKVSIIRLRAATSKPTLHISVRAKPYRESCPSSFGSKPTPNSTFPNMIHPTPSCATMSDTGSWSHKSSTSSSWQTSCIIGSRQSAAAKESISPPIFDLSFIEFSHPFDSFLLIVDPTWPIQFNNQYKLNAQIFMGLRILHLFEPATRLFPTVEKPTRIINNR